MAISPTGPQLTTAAITPSSLCCAMPAMSALAAQYQPAHTIKVTYSLQHRRQPSANLSKSLNQLKRHFCFQVLGTAFVKGCSTCAACQVMRCLCFCARVPVSLCMCQQLPTGVQML